MSALEEAGKRLVDDIWTAARDPRVHKDPAAVQRWRTYGAQKVLALVEEEVTRRLAEAKGS